MFNSLFMNLRSLKSTNVVTMTCRDFKLYYLLITLGNSTQLYFSDVFYLLNLKSRNLFQNTNDVTGQ